MHRFITFFDPPWNLSEASTVCLRMLAKTEYDIPVMTNAKTGGRKSLSVPSNLSGKEQVTHYRSASWGLPKGKPQMGRKSTL